MKNLTCWWNYAKGCKVLQSRGSLLLLNPVLRISKLSIKICLYSFINTLYHFINILWQILTLFQSKAFEAFLNRHIRIAFFSHPTPYKLFLLVLSLCRVYSEFLLKQRWCLKVSQWNQAKAEDVLYCIAVSRPEGLFWSNGRYSWE